MDKPPFHILRQTMADALFVIDANLSDKGIKAFKRREEWFQLPYHILVENLGSQDRALKAAELIMNASLYSMGLLDKTDQPFQYYPPTGSTDPWEARGRRRFETFEYRWNIRKKALIFDIFDEGFGKRNLIMIRRQLEKWEKLLGNQPETEEPAIPTLYVVAGAARSVGRGYFEKFKEFPSSYCVGIARAGEEWWEDRQNEPDVLRFNIGEFDGYQDHMHYMLDAGINIQLPPGPLRVVLVYTIGPFKYQGHPDLGDPASIPDPKIYDLNFTAFRDLAGMLEDIMERRKDYQGTFNRLDLVALSTIALNRLDSSLFPAYAVANANMESFSKNFARKTSGGIVRSAQVYRTSTMETPSEDQMRRGADEKDKKHWITPAELVAWTADDIREMRSGEFRIKEVFKRRDDYQPGIHQSLKSSREKWRKELDSKYNLGELPKGVPMEADPSLHLLWASLRQKLRKPDGSISWKDGDLPPDSRTR